MKKQEIKVVSLKNGRRSKKDVIETLEKHMYKKSHIRDYALFITLIHCDNKIEEILSLKVSEREKIRAREKKVNMLITRLIKEQQLSQGDYLFKSQKKGHLKRPYISILLSELYSVFPFEKMTVLQMRKALKEAKKYEN